MIVKLVSLLYSLMQAYRSLFCRNVSRLLCLSSTVLVVTQVSVTAVWFNSVPAFNCAFFSLLLKQRSGWLYCGPISLLLWGAYLFIFSRPFRWRLSDEHVRVHAKSQVFLIEFIILNSDKVLFWQASISVLFPVNVTGLIPFLLGPQLSPKWSVFRISVGFSDTNSPHGAWYIYVECKGCSHTSSPCAGLSAAPTDHKQPVI